MKKVCCSGVLYCTRVHVHGGLVQRNCCTTCRLCTIDTHFQPLSRPGLCFDAASSHILEIGIENGSMERNLTSRTFFPSLSPRTARSARKTAPRTNARYFGLGKVRRLMVRALGSKTDHGNDVKGEGIDSVSLGALADIGVNLHQLTR